MPDIELIIKVPEKIIYEGFERPFTEDEKNILMRAIGNGKPIPTGYCEERERGECPFYAS